MGEWGGCQMLWGHREGSGVDRVWGGVGGSTVTVVVDAARWLMSGGEAGRGPGPPGWSWKRRGHGGGGGRLWGGGQAHAGAGRGGGWSEARRDGDGPATTASVAAHPRGLTKI